MIHLKMQQNWRESIRAKSGLETKRLDKWLDKMIKEKRKK